MSLLSIGDVAEMLSVSRDTVYRLVASGSIRASKVGRAWRFAAEDVAAYLDDSPHPAETGTLRDAAAADPPSSEIARRMNSDTWLQFTEFAVNHSPDGAYWIRGDGRFVYVNETACRMLGYARDELLERSVADIDPQFRTSPWSEMFERLRQVESLTFDSSHQTKHGRVFPVEISANYLEFLGEQCVCAYARDMTVRRQAEHKLRLSEERFQRAVQGSADGLWDWTIETGEVYYSPRFAELLGYDESEFLQNLASWQSRLHPDDQGRVWQAVEAHLNGLAPYDIEYRIRAKSGDYIWVLARGQAIWDQHGLPTKMAGSVTDVTARRRFEEELVRQRAETQTILDALPSFVWLMDPDHRIVRVNRTVAQAVGHRAADLVGRDSAELFPASADEFKAHDRAAIQSGGPTCGSIQRCETGRGDVYWLRIDRIPVLDKSGEVTGLIVVATDVTTLKRTEGELREATERAQRANAAKSDFLANMSHEIRTPLTAILGFADLLAETAESEKSRHAVGTIRRNGEHLLEIVNDLLDLSLIESGDLRIETVACSPMAVIDEVIELMQHRAKEKGLELTATFDGTTPYRILSDPTRLRQILVNLVGNAIKFTEHGSVRINVESVAENGNLLRFRVTDTGIGIPAELTKHLFQPFSQAQATNQLGGGIGLGLTISKRLAHLLGGDVTVETALGKGSTFNLTIDASAPKQPAAPTDLRTVRMEMARSSSANSQPLRNRRILLAEDGSDNIRLLCLILNKAGAHVTTAENGVVAVDKALAAFNQGTPFDAVLMDMQMPVLDGYQATTHLREAGYPGKIIALTARAMRGDREECLAAGCDEFIVKPINRASLLETMQQIMTPASR